MHWLIVNTLLLLLSQSLSHNRNVCFLPPSHLNGEKKLHKLCIYSVNLLVEKMCRTVCSQRSTWVPSTVDYMWNMSIRFTGGFEFERYSSKDNSQAGQKVCEALFVVLSGENTPNPAVSSELWVLSHCPGWMFRARSGLLVKYGLLHRIII